MPSDRLPGVDVLSAVGATRAAVLVLHGGKADSYEPSEDSHLSRRRLVPFAKALHQKGSRHGIDVWTVRYRVRGWNGADQSPVHDARWALEELRRHRGDVPVVVLGHSMGGRVAVHLLDDPSVVGVVALCPWLPDEPPRAAAGKRVVIAHAAVDRWTSPRQSLAWTAVAEQGGALAQYVRVRRTGHFMLRRAGLWTDLASGFALKSLGVEPSVGRAATNVLSKAAAGATSLTV